MKGFIFSAIVATLVVNLYGIETFEAPNPPITFLTGHKGFQPLHMGKQKDYFISTEKVNAKNELLIIIKISEIS